MDEVGRGTGTNDGLSIAWAVCEELLNRIKCRTLFATHYHELSYMHHANLANRSMDVLEENNEIIFLRKLKEGSAAESYGIHVARLAGLSDEVVERAQEIMDTLRQRDAGLDNKAVNTESVSEKSRASGSIQKPVEGSSLGIKKLLQEIKSFNINTITPLQALEQIGKWQQKLVNEDKKTTIIRIPENSAEKSKNDNSAAETPSLFD